MSDNDKPQDEARPKQKKGFALNPQNINRGGRKVGAKNKPKGNLTDNQIDDLLTKNAPEAMRKLVSIMNGTNENNQLKAAIKILDYTYSVSKDKKGLKIAKTKAKGGTEEPAEKKPKATGTDGGSVVTFISKEYSPDKE